MKIEVKPFKHYSQASRTEIKHICSPNYPISEQQNAFCSQYCKEPPRLFIARTTYYEGNFNVLLQGPIEKILFFLLPSIKNVPWLGSRVLFLDNQGVVVSTDRKTKSWHFLGSSLKCFGEENKERKKLHPKQSIILFKAKQIFSGQGTCSYPSIQFTQVLGILFPLKWFNGAIR